MNGFPWKWKTRSMKIRFHLQMRRVVKFGATRVAAPAST